MCLIVFAYKQHPDYDFVFAANRDEFYDRPTEAAHFWDQHPSLLAGKDLKAGGTWMGITRSGSFSALTNYRDLSITKENAPSRGHLVLDFLTGDKAPAAYLEQIDEKAHKFNGFNLLVGNMNELMYYSNQQREVQSLSPGTYGLSNHLLNTGWPKVKQAREAMKEAISRNELSEEMLFRILENDRQAADDALPNTGLPLELERAVSSVFIKTDGYGTRGSTVLVVDKEGRVKLTERLYEPGTAVIMETNRYEFRIDS